MDPNLLLGFAFVLLGAICGGSFGLPSKFAGKDTPWEVLWGPFFFFVTILIPLSLGPVAVKGFFQICSTAGLSGVAWILIFGLLWGFGSMTLGLSFSLVGLSLAYAINYGAQIAFGLIMPMAIHNPDSILTNQGYVILGGAAVCLIGVVICGRAGILKAVSLKKGEPDLGEIQTGTKKPKILIGQMIAFVSGVLCACYGVAFSFRETVMDVAQSEQFGNSPFTSTFVVTALILWGGAFSACGYCVYKLTASKTWKNLKSPGIGKVLLLAFAMACLHDGAIVFYGLGATNLGKLGDSVGYASFMSFAIIVGNINGFLTGEWKGASKQSINWILGGIAVLVVGVCVLAYANTM
jgi:L-rhamnose-H+ transport protein